MQVKLNSPVTNSFIKHVFLASSTSCLNFSSSALLVIYFRKKRSADKFKSREVLDECQRRLQLLRIFSEATLTSSDIERTYQMCCGGESQRSRERFDHLKSNKIRAVGQCFWCRFVL